MPWGYFGTMEKARGSFMNEDVMNDNVYCKVKGAKYKIVYDG